MNTSDSTTESQPDKPNSEAPGQDFQHLKENVSKALGGARQQADAQFGQYRDTAADQIEALAQGAKSFISEIDSKDTLGMSDYLADMAESMSGLAGNLRGKVPNNCFMTPPTWRVTTQHSSSPAVLRSVLAYRAS